MNENNFLEDSPFKKDEHVHSQEWSILLEGELKFKTTKGEQNKGESPLKRIYHPWGWTFSSFLSVNLLRSCSRSPFFKGDSSLFKGEWWVNHPSKGEWWVNHHSKGEWWANHTSKGEWRFTRYTLAKIFTLLKYQ